MSGTKRDRERAVEDGEDVGLVTVTDLLKSVTGELEQPLDRGEIAAAER